MSSTADKQCHTPSLRHDTVSSVPTMENAIRTNGDMSYESDESNTEAIVIGASLQNKPRHNNIVTRISSSSSSSDEDEETDDAVDDVFLAKGNAITSEADSIEEESKSGDEGYGDVTANDFDDAIYQDYVRHQYVGTSSRYHICTNGKDASDDPCKWDDIGERGDDYGVDDHKYLKMLFTAHKEYDSHYCYRLSKEAIKKLIMDFSLMRAHKCMTHAAAEACWDFMKKMSSCVNIPTYKTVRRVVGRHIPKPRMSFIIKNHQDDTNLTVEGDKFKASLYGFTTNYTVLSEKCTLTLEQMRRFHNQMHIKCKSFTNNIVTDIDLSFDGVPLDNSTHKKMMVYSIRFVGCKHCYVFGCHIYTEDNGYSVEECLGPIVQQLRDSSFMRLRYVLADAPMRSFLKCVKGHAGYYSCELCITKGVTCLSRCKPKLTCQPNLVPINEKTLLETGNRKNPPRIASNKQKTNMVSDTDITETEEDTPQKKNPPKNKSIYFEDSSKRGDFYIVRPHTTICFPTTTLYVKKRTSEDWKLIGQRLVSRNIRGMDNDVGITGYCPLFLLEGFDMIRDCPPDPMHFMMLGNGKRIVTQSLAKKHTKKMIQAIDHVYRATMLTSECQRRTRSMSYVAHFKSSEFRALIMVAFILVSARFHQFGNEAEAKVWLIYCYICRVSLLPQPLYLRMKTKCHLPTLVQRFYDQYEETFTQKSCVFNVHLFSHIFDIRDKEELDVISTEPFESSYNYVKRMYRAGTPSISKQILENMCVLRMKRHICKPCVLIQPKTGYSKVRDDLIYTKDMKFYIVKEVMDKSFLCHAVLVEDYHSRIDVTLNFTDIGVMTYTGIDLTYEVVILKMDVIAKAVICDKVIACLPFGSNFT
jgi:hypothetical protein